jgi:hypothetical protein
MKLLNNASQQTSMYSTGARLKAGASLYYIQNTFSVNPCRNNTFCKHTPRTISFNKSHFETTFVEVVMQFLKYIRQNVRTL